MMLLKPLLLFIAVVATTVTAGILACTPPASASQHASSGRFALIDHGRPVPVLVDASADPAVRRVARSLAGDLKRVSGQEARVLEDPGLVQGPAVVIGELGKSTLIDSLAKAGKLDVGGLAGRWEAFRIATVSNPWPSVSQALVVLGSDRRGAVYGAYDLSERLGVSAWHWFADVPIARQQSVTVSSGTRTDAPKVRYRGFFINDEDPALGGWAKKRFGGVNSRMYEHVFELLLRLKGNYLWPAMWAPKAFHLDDPRNTKLADEMGVVMGSSHHEPMTRAQAEWHRSPQDPTTGGAWNYATNAENLRKFWRGGIERMMSKGDGKGYDSLVTVGMRGDGDEPMSEGTAIQLLETIVADQRRIVAEVTGKPASQTPQVWALYKEVQDYYDQGMTVPEDVTLLFADDNWGQIRRLPTKNLDREGGYGVYYHFDYVGGPRNYKWLNTIQIEKVWQQMDLAYSRGARQVWVVNVGDIKPMEYPLDFFMRMAWDPEAMTPRALKEFPEAWARRSFGDSLASEIGELVTRYSTYAARRKPELINQDAFPIGEVEGKQLRRGHFGEYVEQWRSLVRAMEQTKARLKPEQQSAFFQLIEFPIAALSNLYEMYYATAWNRRLASSHDTRANYFLTRVQEAFARDAELTAQYHALENGKWDGMMSQVHMSYVIWNEPTQQTMPSVTYVASDKPLDKRNTEVLFSPEPLASDKLVLEASRFTRAVGGKGLEWKVIEDLGQSDAAVIAYPQGRPATTLQDGVRLEYEFTTQVERDWSVVLNLSPTLDTTNSGGIRIGLALDGRAAQTVVSDLVPTAGAARTPQQRAWFSAVINNRHSVKVRFDKVPAGLHTLRVLRLDDQAVLESIEIVP